MKKQLLILLLFSLNASAQNAKFPRVRLSVPCTTELTDNYKGKWLVHKNELAMVSTGEFNSEALKRIDQLNSLIYEICPQPSGADIAWNGSFIKTSFGDQVKFQMNQNDMLNEEHVKINPVWRYQYNLILFPWSCCGINDICNIFPEISGGTGVTIHANYLEIAKSNILNGNEWTIDGRSIKFKMPTIGKWKGYELMSSEGGANAALLESRFVLITRPGMLPYVPVTRKQYLDRAIPYVKKTYDQYIADAEKMSDKTAGDEYKKGYVKDKEAALKKYQDALDESTKKGLLDAPAIVLTGPGAEFIAPIFSTESEGGRMLVTENPGYFRKDLPKYVPQFFILTWSGKSSMKAGDNWSYNFRKLVEEKFPIEKLQAMIDK